MHAWEVVVWIVIIFAGLGFLIWSFLTWRRWRKERKADEAEAPYITWAIAVMKATTDEEILNQGSIYADDRYGRVSNTGFYNRARKIFASAERRNTSRKLANELKDTDDLRLAFGILDVDSATLDSEIVLGVAEQSIPDFFLAHLQDMLDKARAGSKDSLEGYLCVMRSHRAWKFFKRHRLSKPAFPEDWDDLVVSLVPAPDVSYFRNVGKKSPGEVSLMAGEAIRTDNSKLAKLVLAYCRKDEAYRRAVGEVLQAELIKLVDRHERLETYDSVPSEAS